MTSKRDPIAPARAITLYTRDRMWSFICTLIFMIFCFVVNAQAGIVRVEVLYMNHPPMQPTIGQLKGVFSKYGEKIAVSWYDVDTREGQQLMAKKGLHEHVPLMIWIQGSQTAQTGRGTVAFAGFPSGSGPGPFQGDWTMQDLKAALDRAISPGR